VRQGQFSHSRQVPEQFQERFFVHQVQVAFVCLQDLQFCSLKIFHTVHLRIQITQLRVCTTKIIVQNLLAHTLRIAVLVNVVILAVKIKEFPITFSVELKLKKRWMFEQVY
jgi:hypothetical protein